jgi:hypothetical protein
MSDVNIGILEKDTTMIINENDLEKEKEEDCDYAWSHDEVQKRIISLLSNELSEENYRKLSLGETKSLVLDRLTDIDTKIYSKPKKKAYEFFLEKISTSNTVEKLLLVLNMRIN